jgi:kynurenine formamidase
MAEGAYNAEGGNSPQWWPSRYGEGDTIGAGNEITPERTLEALTLPKEGKVITIAQTLEPGVPAYPPREFHMLVLAHQTLQQYSPEGSQMVGFEEHVTQTYHVGCHLDGLGHVGINGHFYNGVHYNDFYTNTGLTKYGMEGVRPWVTRGVCLDIAALEKTKMLEGGYVITPEHLEAAQERQGVEVKPGDAVLLHTGWADLWMKEERYGEVEPGAGWDACHWLTERNVSMVAADNWAFEVLPFEKPEWGFVGHQHLLAETGTYIVENIRTQELVDGGHSEFLYMMAPNKTKGATGSMVSPLCIV